MPQRKKKSLALNLLINIVIPVLVLTRLSGDEFLGSVWGLVVALAFPVAYGAWDFAAERKVNFFSALGLVSILLTGVIGLFTLPNEWLAWKEAGVPLLIGLVVLISQGTKWPLVKLLLGEAIDFENVDRVAREKQTVAEVDSQVRVASYLVAATFFISAASNYFLARTIVVSEPGSVAYTVELGKLTAWSFPAIVVPLLIILAVVVGMLLHGVRKATGLKMDEVLRQ